MDFEEVSLNELLSSLPSNKYWATDKSFSYPSCMPELPILDLFCRKCDRISKFKGIPQKEAGDGRTFSEYKNAFYYCKNCDEYHYVFFLRRVPEVESVQNKKRSLWYKVAQYPMFELPVPAPMQRFLQGKYWDLYQKGRRLEIQGHGIGAFSYYRRIVEDNFKDLIKKISSVLDPVKDRDQLDRLENAKNNWRFSDAADQIKDLIPDSLKMEGRDTLVLLHSSISEGLHNLSDEECLKKSKYIRLILEHFLVKIKTLNDEKEILNNAASNLSA